MRRRAALSAGLLLSLFAHCLSVAAQSSLAFGSDGVLRIAQFTDLHMGEGPESDYLTGQVSGQLFKWLSRQPLSALSQAEGMVWWASGVNYQALWPCMPLVTVPHPLGALQLRLKLCRQHTPPTHPGWRGRCTWFALEAQLPCPHETTQPPPSHPPTPAYFPPSIHSLVGASH